MSETHRQSVPRDDDSELATTVAFLDFARQSVLPTWGSEVDSSKEESKPRSPGPALDQDAAWEAAPGP